MHNDGFIFLLSLGSALLVGIVAVAHFSASRLARRRGERNQAASAREPQFEFGELAPGADVVGGITAPTVRARIATVDRAQA